jgi:hypothetical protein
MDESNQSSKANDMVVDNAAFCSDEQVRPAFVERRSTKERTRQPPPQKKEHSFFTLRSTAEKISALVYMRGELGPGVGGGI